MKKALQVILHLLGFPLLIALVVLVNLPIIQGGKSYGIMVYVGIIVTAVMALIYYIAFICLVKSKKKSKLKQTVALILVVFFTLGGLWLVVDLALPDFFANATSNTVYYEDLVDNYQARAVVQENLLNEYITRAYNAHNLPNEKEGGYSLEEYLEQGVKNEDVSKLLVIQFASIDQDGYAAFGEAWIGMANDNRLTIPVLLHLLTDDRTATMEHVDFALYDKAKKKVENDPVIWNVLDMLGTPMELELGLDEDVAGLIDAIIKVLGKEGVAEMIGKIVGDPDIIGSPIYLYFNDSQLVLTPSNEKRGVLDYMSMAWLNSNGLLYAIVTLLSVRNLFLIFAGWMVLTNFLIGLLRGMGKEKVSLVKIKGGAEPTQPQMTQQPANPNNPYRYGFGDGSTQGFAVIDIGTIKRNLMINGQMPQYQNYGYQNPQYPQNPQNPDNRGNR